MEDFSAFQKAVTDALVASTRTAGQIASEDLSFHRSSSSTFSNALDAQNVRLLQLTNRLLKAAASGSYANVTAPQLDDLESVEDNWRGVVDVVDDLLEKTDRCLDEYTGVIKRLSPKRDLGDKATSEKSGAKTNKFMSKVMKKPQEDFEKSVDNFETGPWRPLLNVKPHAAVPLETSPESAEAGYKHPYAEEIANYKFPESTYKVADPIPFTPPQDTEAVFVDTEEGVSQMLEELKQADIIAVDLEHHDMHSYIGLVSLMQISSRNKDWIVDTLKPWRENLQILNEVFADPSILKVFHGSNSDMIWLQRDLGLYVVGLFDTYYAACALNLPRKSLKFLLERFAQFEAQKMYQLSDWRIRPLPAELIDYARSDTHYLLNVFDQIRNLLVEASSPNNNLIDYVLEQSKKEALQRYERPIYDSQRGLGPVSWYGPLARRSVKFTNEQFAVYRALHEWRDTAARKSDEGVGAVLSINTLFNIANTMPESGPALFAAANPVSRAVRDGQNEILDLVKAAKEESKNQPSFWQVMQDNDLLLAPTKKYRKPWERDHPAREFVAEPKDTVEALDITKVSAGISTNSELWGSTILDALDEVNWQAQAINNTIAVILPIPATAEVGSAFDTAPTVPTSGVATPMTPLPEPESTEPTPNAKSDIFTIKDLKRKEKIKSFDETPDKMSLDVEDVDQDGLTKSERKALRKEQRRRKKLGTNGTNPDQQQEEEVEEGNEAGTSEEKVPPAFFDYSSAPSVLHAQANVPYDKRKEAEKERKRKNFDPYAKAMDAPKGMKRQRKETAGRSMTFRN